MWRSIQPARRLSKQDAFARHGFQEGYPLWNPDPVLLLQDRQEKGLEIGDIGIVDEDGCFNTIHNIYHSVGLTPGSLAPAEGPNIYECEAFDVGHVFSSPETSWDNKERPAPYYTTSHDVNHGRVITQYTSSLTEDGSHIIVPQGAKCFKLSPRDKFILQSRAADPNNRTTWFNLASNHFGFTPTTLFLITALYQTRSWSLASFNKKTEEGVGVLCELVVEGGKLQMGHGGSHWAPQGRFAHKIGPPAERQGNSNQTIFIQSLVITRTNNKRPLRRPQFSTVVTQNAGGKGTAALQPRTKSSHSTPSNQQTGGLGHKGTNPAAQALAIESTAVIQHIPPKSLASHPLELLHLYLLAKHPAADVAMTYDNLWMKMLTDGDLLKLEDLESDLVGLNYFIVVNNGVIYLRNKSLSLRYFGVQSPINTSECVKKNYRVPFARHYLGDLFESTLQNRGQDIKVAVRVIEIKEYTGDSSQTIYKKKNQVHRMIELWSELDHRNILPLIWEFEKHGRLYVVSPWTENGTLTAYLERKHRELTERQLLRLGGDVASGINYLHSKGILHSALSGSNIVVDNSGIAMLIGISHAMTLLDEKVSPLIAQSEEQADPLRWAAPESLGLWSELGSSCILTKESNVWSFGRIMLQIYSGKVPYHYYETGVKVASAIKINETPQRPDDPHLTDHRWKIIEECCRNDKRLTMVEVLALIMDLTPPDSLSLTPGVLQPDKPSITVSAPQDSGLVQSDGSSLAVSLSTQASGPRFTPMVASSPVSPPPKGVTASQLSRVSSARGGSGNLSLEEARVSGIQLDVPLSQSSSPRSLPSERGDPEGGRNTQTRRDHTDTGRSLLGRWLKRTTGSTFQLNEDDVVVFVVGPAGSGKSRFVRAVTNADDLDESGKSHQYSPDEALAIRCELTNEAREAFGVEKQKYIVFVDTPSFHTRPSERIQAEKNMAKWLRGSRCKSTRLGIIYLHRIGVDPTDDVFLARKHLDAFFDTFPEDFISQEFPMRSHCVFSHAANVPEAEILDYIEKFRVQLRVLCISIGSGLRLQWSASTDPGLLEKGDPIVAWTAAVEQLFAPSR